MNKSRRFRHADQVRSQPQALHAAVSPGRAAAFDILLRVQRESSYASELLHSRTYGRLTEPDRSLMTELVMGVLRWRSLLDSEIAASSDKPLAKLDLEILIALRLALYQLRGLTRVPARAAIHESVELVKRARKRSAAPFVNAVLRKLAVGADQAAPPVIENASPEILAATSAHPLWLVERWWNAYGPDAALRICRQNQSIPVTTIRLRHSGPEVAVQLRAEGIEVAPGELMASARKIVRGDITRTDAFRAGLCVIQDEASQLVAALVGHAARILDCCAAPGGKTTAIADANPQAGIIAVELHPHRTRLLRRLARTDDSASNTGPGNISAVTADARNLPFLSKFDRVLADVPCSGTGTLSRNPEIKWRLVPEDLADLQTRQLAILTSAMGQVTNGGRLIYSTCSLENEENEDVIEGLLEKDSTLRVIDCGMELARLKQEGTLIWPDPASLVRGAYLRTLPGLHPCDGFFAAILERT